jgi:hypothetical protein
VHAEQLASLKLDRPETYPRNFGVAEVTVFEGTVFETAAMEILIGKIAIGESTALVLSNLKI